MEATSSNGAVRMADPELARPPSEFVRGKPGDVGAQRAAPANARRAFGIWGACALLVLAALGGYAWLLSRVEATDNAQVLADQMPIASRETGVIKLVQVKDDQRVRAGDVLFVLDDADLAARAAQAQAEVVTAEAEARAADAQVGIVEANARGTLQVARAALQGSSNAVNGAAAQLAGARAELARATIEDQRAEQDLHRTSELRAKHAVSQEQLEIAQAARDGAAATLSRARAQLTFAEESQRAAERKVGEAHGRVGQSEPVALQIETAQAGAALAHGRLSAAQAALTIARLRLSYTRVRAPSDGTVSKIVARDGQYVNAGQALAQLVATKTYVVANFKEEQIENIRPGQRVQVEVDAHGGKPFAARVTSIAAGTGAAFSLVAPDNATGNFIRLTQRVPVRIDWIEQPSVALQSGLSAEVEIERATGASRR